MAGPNTKRLAQRRRFGFTLIEVALGATILAVGFVGMIDALALGSQMLDTAHSQTIAGQIMQGEMEYWRMQLWSTVTSAGSSGLNSHDAAVLANYPEFASTNLAALTGERFTFARTVTAVPDRSDLILQVTMTVTWTGITGKTHSRSMSSYLGRYGLDVSYRKL